VRDREQLQGKPLGSRVHPLDGDGDVQPVRYVGIARRVGSVPAFTFAVVQHQAGRDEHGEQDQWQHQAGQLTDALQAASRPPSPNVA
jgi:hypothetical protein